MTGYARRNRTETRRGGALIISVAVLAVMATLALSFARLMVMERDAATTQIETTRARFLAHAGAEYGMTHVHDVQAGRGYTTWRDPWVYHGEDGVDLAESPDVSLQAGVEMGYPFSGVLARPAGAEKYSTNGLHFALRVRDLTSLIYVGRIEGGFNGNRRLLDNLGRLQRADGTFAVLDGTMGSALAAREPAQGYREFVDVEAALIAQYGGSAALTTDFELLQDYVTTVGWTDPKTVRPGANYLAMVSGSTDRAAASPINLNTAPVALLEAAFAGVQATWTDANGSVVVHTVSDTAAQYLAARIQIERESFTNDQKDEGTRDPFFYSFADLERFLTRVALESGSGLSRRDAAVLLAMLNPNGRILRFNPDLRLRYLSDDPVDHLGHTTSAARTEDNRIYADKSTLTQWTTEGCFDAVGMFRIESLGRVIALSGQVIAQHLITVVVRVAQKYRWTTQSDFADLLASGTSQFVDSYPESLPNNGAAHSASTTTGGLRAGESDDLPGTATLAALRSGDGKAFLPAGHSVATAPWAPLNTTSILSGTGDLVDDGYLSDPARGHVQTFDAKAHMPLTQGTTEFWTKFSEKGFRQSGGLFWAINDLPETATVALANYDEGIDTVAYYEYDPVTHRGYIHISRTYFHFSDGIPGSGQALGLKWELNGKIKPDAIEILKEEGRKIIQPSIDQMTSWTQDEKDRWREVFAQWFAERVIAAFTGGQNMGPETKIVGIGHAVIEDIEDLPVMCDRWSSDSLDNLYPLIFEGGVQAAQREWVAAAYHTVVNETDKYSYSYKNFAVNPNDYGEYYMELVTDPIDGVKKKRWEALKNVYSKVLERGLELPYAASRVEIVKEVYREAAVGAQWVPTADSWKAGEWHNIQFGWQDTTGYLDAWFDGRDDYDTIDEWGPLNVWSSRMRDLTDRIYIGSYILDRASDDSGNVAAANRDLYWYTQATTDRLIVRSDTAAGMPTQDRYQVEAGSDPNLGANGSHARFSLPLRTLFGSSLDRSTGMWIDWTEYEPTSVRGEPYVQAQIWLEDAGAWIRLHRSEHGTKVAGLIGPAQRAAVAGKPDDVVQLSLVFEDTGEPRENPADALDQTPFLDDVSVTIATSPEVLSWQE